MQGKTGITVDTVGRRLLGKGICYIDYGEAGERELGAVIQGQFDPGITLGQGEDAGAIGRLKGRDYISLCEPTLQLTLIEVTTDNLKQIFPGGDSASTTQRTTREGEYVGEGDDLETAFSLEEDYVYEGTLRVWKTVGGAGDPVLLTEGAAADYTVVYATGVITFNAAPATGDIITAEYVFDPNDDAVAYDSVRAGEIAEADYPTNIAWVGEIAGATGDLIIIVHNPLPTETSAWTLEDKGEVGVQATFRGSVAGDAPQTIPFEIRRPTS